MNDFYEENKKTIIIIGILVVLTIIFSIASLFIGKGNKTIKPEDAMKELGSVYYEEIFYPQLKEEYPELYIEVLNKKGSEGIKMTLSDLMFSLKNVNGDAFIDEKNETFCDAYDTYVVIYPTGNYDLEDYRLDVKVSCNSKITTGEEVEYEKK